MVAALALGPAAGWGPAPQARAAGPAPARAVLATWRHGTPLPGLQLSFEPAAARSWSLGVDFAGDPGRLQAVWGRHLWRLSPDALALVGLQAGVYLLPHGALGLPPGAWLGLYAGERWWWASAVLELGTSFVLPAQRPGQVGWETTASVGFGW